METLAEDVKQLLEAVKLQQFEHNFPHTHRQIGESLKLFKPSCRTENLKNDPQVKRYFLRATNLLASTVYGKHFALCHSYTVA
jgi:hypothetical protein